MRSRGCGRFGADSVEALAAFVAAAGWRPEVERAAGTAARRVENRCGGADANPYIALAASLACGYLGMVEALEKVYSEVGGNYEL